MEDMQAMFTATLALFKTPLTLYGFTFSMWEIFLWGIVAGLLIWFVLRALDN